jgi:simple sugar transport system substrate-binding protein
MRKRIWTLLALGFVVLWGVTPALAADDFIFGMLLVGPYNDKGWSQAHYEAGKYVEAKAPGTKMLYLDKVNPADRPGFTIPQLVDDLVAKGAKLIIANSDDMKDGAREAAKKHPKVTFLHVSGDDVLTGKGTPNLGNLMGRMEYTKAMAGFAAAMTTKNGKIGYLGPLINEETRRLAASVYLGAHYAWTKVLGKKAEDLKFQVSWIGFWFNIPGVTADPTQVCNKFFDGGYDVVISGIDTPEALTVAKQKQAAGKAVWAVPYDFEGACQGADQVCLGVPYFNWGPAYRDLIQAVRDGKWKPAWDWNAPNWKNINDKDTSAVGFLPGAALSADAKAALDKFIAGLADGSIQLFKGPLFYQDGKPFVKEGAVATDKEIWYMEQLLKGMEGASSAQK